MVKCPKCEAVLKGTFSAKCETCKHEVHKEECVACGETFYSVQAGLSRLPVHNHQCDPRKLRMRDADCSREGRSTPTEHERLREGFDMLSDEY